MRNEQMKLPEAKRAAAELSRTETNRPVYVVVADGGLCFLSYKHETGTIHAYINGDMIQPDKAAKASAPKKTRTRAPADPNKPKRTRKKKLDTESDQQGPTLEQQIEEGRQNGHQLVYKKKPVPFVPRYSDDLVMAKGERIGGATPKPDHVDDATAYVTFNVFKDKRNQTVSETVYSAKFDREAVEVAPGVYLHKEPIPPRQYDTVQISRPNPTPIEKHKAENYGKQTLHYLSLKLIALYRKAHPELDEAWDDVIGLAIEGKWVYMDVLPEDMASEIWDFVYGGDLRTTTSQDYNKQKMLCEYVQLQDGKVKGRVVKSTVSVAGHKFPVTEGNPFTMEARKKFKRVPANDPPQLFDGGIDGDLDPDTPLGAAIAGLMAQDTPEVEVPAKRKRGRPEGDTRKLPRKPARALEATATIPRGKGKEPGRVAKTDGKASKYKLVMHIVSKRTIAEAVRQVIADKSKRGLIQVQGKTYGFSCSNTYQVKRAVYETSTHGMVMIFKNKRGYLVIPKQNFEAVFGDVVKSATYKKHGIYTVNTIPKWIEADFWHKIPYKK